MNQQIQLIRSNRKSIAIEIKPDLQVILRAPYRMSNREIQKFIEEKSDWIEKNLKIVAARKEERENRPQLPKLTAKDINELADQAMKVIPERVRHFAPIVGVHYGRITIRNQRTRWGSCSAKGNLNFNCLLMKTPMEVIDYVVVHELCHRLEMNHSKKFWAEVERVYPQYKEAKKWMKQYGNDIINSML